MARQQWYQRYAIPNVGDDIVFVLDDPKRYGKFNYYLGLIDQVDQMSSGYLERMPDGQSLEDGGVGSDQPDIIVMMKSDGIISDSRFHSTIYVRHLLGKISRDKYMELAVETFSLASAKIIFQRRRCQHGFSCRDLRPGHLINLSH